MFNKLRFWFCFVVIAGGTLTPMITVRDCGEGTKYVKK